jgi:hypothetical protein
MSIDVKVDASFVVKRDIKKEIVLTLEAQEIEETVIEDIEEDQIHLLITIENAMIVVEETGTIVEDVVIAATVETDHIRVSTLEINMDVE